MTQKELDNLVRRWQETLGLRDWAIGAKITREPSQDEDNAFCDAWAYLDPQHRHLDIEIVHRDVATGRGNRLIPWRGYEVCLVHEMLHAWFTMAPTCEMCEEQAINAIAEALVGR